MMLSPLSYDQLLSQLRREPGSSWTVGRGLLLLSRELWERFGLFGDGARSLKELVRRGTEGRVSIRRELWFGCQSLNPGVRWTDCPP